MNVQLELRTQLSDDTYLAFMTLKLTGGSDPSAVGY